MVKMESADSVDSLRVHDDPHPRVGRGRFFKMFFVRPGLRYGERPSTLSLFLEGHDGRENQNLVSEVTVSQTRERHWAW